MKAGTIFRLVEREHTRAAGVSYVHARLQARRLGHWHVVGVFQLTEGEWAALVACCEALGIDTGKDVEEPAVSS